MPYTNTAKSTMLDALAADIDQVSLHDSDPGNNGSNEIAGGSPAYARKEPTFAASSQGEKPLDSSIEFDVPSGATVAWIGYWNSVTGNFLGSAELAQQEDYGSQGTFTLNTDTKLKISDLDSV